MALIADSLAPVWTQATKPVREVVYTGAIKSRPMILAGEADPMYELARIAWDEDTPLELRVTILRDMVGYIYPKLKAVLVQDAGPMVEHEVRANKLRSMLVDVTERVAATKRENSGGQGEVIQFPTPA